MSTIERASLPGIDLLDETWAAGVPHDQFDRLRREAPVYWHHENDGGPGFWALTKHADVKRCSHDWRTFSSELGATFIPSADEEMLAQLQLTILNMDPPKHERYRRLVSKGFTPRMIRILVEDIERRATKVVDEVCERGEIEFVEELAGQVPVQMICEMIGLEKELWPRMFEVSNQLVGGRNDPEYQTLEGGPEAAALEVYMLCDQVAADRRAHPRDDIMSALVQAEIDGERLGDAELNLFFVTLIVAGNETTRNLINHSLLALIDHPDQAARLREDPSLWDTAVEEMLRWGSSIHNFRRTATCDTEVRGVPIREGEKVVLYYASANRDEEVFADPHTFDIARTPNDHVTFGGGGVHFCLGASLARAEIKATMRQIVERLPDIELAGTPTRLRSDFVNGIKQMPVRFTPTKPVAG
ncbi:MAG TPA: cytochrome P450 [Acidimicrobiales bacterium]|jgi:cholest-4-en-3-one 26-monooxygenase|nr:cytochrome P450 [Acidimicrobiales bacterium]